MWMQLYVCLYAYFEGSWGPTGVSRQFCSCEFSQVININTGQKHNNCFTSEMVQNWLAGKDCST